MDPSALRSQLPNAAFAFRGYNVTNLGRTPELLAHTLYGPIVADALRRASTVCEKAIGRPVDLVARVVERRETSLESYHEAVSLIVAVEQAQLRILNRFFRADYRDARLAFGYSLGELAALVASGVFDEADAVQIPLLLSADCVALAEDAVMAVLFSRGDPLSIAGVRRLCLGINQEGRGVIGISAILAPNSILLMGQGDTLDRFRSRMRESIGSGVALRENRDRWPPLHTPIMWQKAIPDRAAHLMHTLPGGLTAPHPPVLSLATGLVSYDEVNVRETIHRWIDQPQRLWDAVYQVLALGIAVVIHVGPEPNIIPATFRRLADNVDAQTRASLGLRALSEIARRTWLGAVLPRRTALLRAPRIIHIRLEDWLLDHPPG
ncbi:MAG: ACP S-malonyltransferase [Planctomycetes bacterium]|nr:ACP S-malonyltransferase [Planctomycetota bacterium]